VPPFLENVPIFGCAHSKIWPTSVVPLPLWLPNSTAPAVVSCNLFRADYLIFCFALAGHFILLQRCPANFASNLVSNDGAIDTIRFLVTDAILEVTEEGPVIRCSKYANNVSCYCCCGLERLRGVHGYGRLRHSHLGEIYTFGSVTVGVPVSL